MFSFKHLADVEARFGLTRSLDPDFFPSSLFPGWRKDLPTLSLIQHSALEVFWNRLNYHRGLGDLLEGAVTLLAASPLLEIAGFYDPPFQMKAEAAVELSVEDGEETLRGRIDVLVLQTSLWVLVLESKKTTISVRSALPQALAYLMGAPAGKAPLFGMLTNGDDVVFVKVVRGAVRQYALSRVFSLYAVPEDGGEVVRVLMRLGMDTRN